MSKIKRLIHRIFPGWGIIKENKENENFRRLVKNPKTGRYEFTEGAEAFPTTKEELDLAHNKVKKKFEPLGGEELVDKKKLFIPYEPYRDNRFIVEIMDFDSWVINSFSKNGLTKEGFIKMVIPIGGITFDRLFELNSKLQEAKDRPYVKLKEDVVVKLLDPTGVVLKEIVFKEPEVVEVGLLETLTYSKSEDNIMTGSIRFKYKSEVNKILDGK
jgi:hypothetical protein